MNIHIQHPAARRYIITALGIVRRKKQKAIHTLDLLTRVETALRKQLQ
jgi:hypothetical protein